MLLVIRLEIAQKLLCVVYWWLYFLPKGAYWSTSTSNLPSLKLTKCIPHQSTSTQRRESHNILMHTRFVAARTHNHITHELAWLYTYTGSYKLTHHNYRIHACTRSRRTHARNLIDYADTLKIRWRVQFSRCRTVHVACHKLFSSASRELSSQVLWHTEPRARACRVGWQWYWSPPFAYQLCLWPFTRKQEKSGQD